MWRRRVTLRYKNKMLLLWKWGWKCHKCTRKPAANHMHHILLRRIFEPDNLGFSPNLEEIRKFFSKNWRRKIWGKNYDKTISFSEFFRMLWNFCHSRYLYWVIPKYYQWHKISTFYKIYWHFTTSNCQLSSIPLTELT